MVRARLSRLPRVTAPRLDPSQEEPITAARASVRKLDKAQAHLVLGFPGARLTDPVRWELEVLSAILSGQGGRLFLELRDKLLLPEGARAATLAAPKPSVDDDVQSALVNLGYRAKDAENAVETARKELGRDAEFSAVLRLALRQLTR